MDKSEFLEEILKILKEKLPEVEISTQPVAKNNETLTGIVVKTGDMGHVFYLEWFINDPFENYTPESAAEEIKEKYRELSGYNAFDEAFLVSFLKDRNNVLRNIRGRIVDQRLNTELLEDKPYRTVGGNLAVLYYIDLPDDCPVPGRIMVNNGHMDAWKIDEEDEVA